MVDGTVALSVLALTLGLFALVGLRSRNAASDLEDFVVARGSQGARALGLSFLASGMGAWILFAPPQVGALVGLIAVIGYALGAAAPLLAFALLGRRMRRIAPAGHSLAEFIRVRFGRAFHAYVVGISILYMLVFVTAELSAIGGIAALLSGVRPVIAILAVALVTLAYTAYGGLRATIRTDRWQGWLLIGLLTGAALVILPSADASLSSLDATGLLEVRAIGVEAGITLIIAVTAANLFHQGYWQRVWAARDDRALARGAAIGAALTLPIVLLVGVIGIVAAGAGAELGQPSVPFFALMTGLPAWLSVVVLALGVCLVASSVDTLENGLAALVAAERPSMSLAAARWATAALLVPAVVVALQGFDVLRLFLIADLLCAATVVPALLGLWARASSGGALAGAISGLAGALIGGWISTGALVDGALAATFPDNTPTLWPFVGAIVASATVSVVVSLIGGAREDLGEISARIPQLSRAAR
ncbi:MAG TPA: hypothetical protein VML96_02190 [Egibacteraceae bacterium]|nr:hypothetical protein [Egibacteraceae bacterium]